MCFPNANYDGGGCGLFGKLGPGALPHGFGLPSPVFDYSIASSYTIRATEKATLFWREPLEKLSPGASEGDQGKLK